MNNQEEIPEYLYPKCDFIFKRIFGYEGNEDITKDLISSILGQKINKLEIKNPYLLREIKKDKAEVLDVKVELDNHILCDVEIQVKNHYNDDKRILDYWAKMYRTTIEKGSEYQDMRRTIVIYITDYNINQLKEIEDYITVWKIMEEKRKIELTNVFQVVILELPKAEKFIKGNKNKKANKLDNWVRFMVNPMQMEEQEMEDVNAEMKKAYEIWHNMNLSEEERDVAERRYMDLISLEYAKKYEYNLGKTEGQKEKQIEIAKNMLAEKFDIETIVKVTGLAKEEIERLKD